MSKPESEWRSIEDIQLLIGKSRPEQKVEMGFIGAVEAKDEARRVMVALVDVPGQPREAIARWRDGVPASVRVLGANRFTPEQRKTIEIQLLAYVQGLRGGTIDGIELAIELDVKPVPPQISSH